MISDMKDKWLIALRSGDYVQTQGVLKDNQGFCCLGVILDIINPENWIPDEVLTWDHWENEDSILPDFVRKDLHLTPDNQCKLISMNDSDCSFETIADWIEEEL